MYPCLRPVHESVIHKLPHTVHVHERKALESLRIILGIGIEKGEGSYAS
jgi:hypothetical protein